MILKQHGILLIKPKVIWILQWGELSQGANVHSFLCEYNYIIN